MIASVMPSETASSATKSPATKAQLTTPTVPSSTSPSGTLPSTATASPAMTSLSKPEPKTDAKKDAPAKNQTPVSANLANLGAEKPDAAATKKPEGPAIKEEVHRHQYI